MKEPGDGLYCSSCRFYIPFRERDTTTDIYKDSGGGWCHRLPPAAVHPQVVVREETKLDWPIWPMVEGGEDWCGEWRSKKPHRPRKVAS